MISSIPCKIHLGRGFGSLHCHFQYPEQCLKYSETNADIIQTSAVSSRPEGPAAYTLFLERASPGPQHILNALLLHFLFYSEACTRDPALSLGLPLFILFPHPAHQPGPLIFTSLTATYSALTLLSSSLFKPSLTWTREMTNNYRLNTFFLDGS